jgi:hypothetical protein
MEGGVEGIMSSILKGLKLNLQCLLVGSSQEKIQRRQTIKIACLPDYDIFYSDIFYAITFIFKGLDEASFACTLSLFALGNTRQDDDN